MLPLARLAGCTLLLGLLAAAPAQAKGPRFYFDVRGVQVPAGSRPELKEKARAILIAELKKQASVVLELGSPAPKGEELEKALKDRKLDGYGLVLRVTKSGHTLQPPPAGKTYKVLMVEVAVAIDAEKIPSGQMALAGEGTASVGTEVTSVKEKERLQLLGEALADAIKQAVAKSITKLGQAGKPEKRPARKKKR